MTIKKSKIGKVSATEKDPSTCNSFTFWLDKDIEIRPFDIVKTSFSIGDKTSTTFGLIQEIIHITDAPTHLTNYVSSDFGDVETKYATDRLGLTYVKADVIHNTENVFMPCPDGSIVEFVNADEVRIALGLDKVKDPLPAGVFRMSNNIHVPITYNRSFVLGQDGAHMNISGISGLATKTSYAMFVLNAIQQTTSDVAFILFNVKGDDLLRIDEYAPNIEKIKKDSTWKDLNLEPKPFSDVKYYYPFLGDSPETEYAFTPLNKKTLKEQANRGKLKTYIYTYEEDKRKLEMMFANIDDPNYTMESIIAHIDNDFEFNKLTNWQEFKDHLRSCCMSGKQTGNIPVQSWRKFSRLMDRALNNSLFQNIKSLSSNYHHSHLYDEILAIQKNEVKVIDISKLEEHMQCFVFGDVIQAVKDLKFGQTERTEEELPKKIIIFVDELNKYAPANAPKASPLLQGILDITERGRSQGIILFSAEQFRSAVHDRVKGNCSTNVYGRTNGIETSKADYKVIPQTFKYMMTSLKQGCLLVEHPTFRSILRLEFPEPAYYHGMEE
ncbi:ATP-binding protein [Candidatus Beckwithbacteria bacterium]|nr:ATP-binding protein [Candidatus Beckwithbacteria bacterium]